jgi:hypothetical protein
VTLRTRRPDREQLLESWSRALESAAKAVDSAHELRVYNDDELRLHQRTLRAERSWLATAGENWIREFPDCTERRVRRRRTGRLGPLLIRRRRFRRLHTPAGLDMTKALVPAGGGGVFDVKIDQPGLYPFVNHSFASVDLGQVGLLKVGDVKGTMSH